MSAASVALPELLASAVRSERSCRSGSGVSSGGDSWSGEFAAGDMQSGGMHFWSKDSHQTSQKQCKSAASVSMLSSSHSGHAGNGPLAGISTQNGKCTCSEALLGMRPAARVSLPMWMIPRRKVPVVMTTLLHRMCSPAAIRHHGLKHLQGQPCIGCMSVAALKLPPR